MNWTPISEALPPALKPVLIKQQRAGFEPFVIVGIHAPARTLEYHGEMFNEWEYHDEATNTYYRPAGFYERAMNRKDEQDLHPCDEYWPVVAWTEIPEGEA